MTYIGARVETFAVISTNGTKTFIGATYTVTN